MNKKLFICVLIFLIFISGIFIYKRIQQNKLLDYSIEQIEEYNYFLLKEENKYGVIDKAGNVVVTPEFDVVEIPNPSKDLFICKNFSQESGQYNIQVLNKENKQILYEYYTVEAIKLNNVEGNDNYEKSVLKYQSDNKFGIIDFNGKKITEPIYESIEGFEYNEGLLLVKKSGKYGILNINGFSVLKEKYDEILSDGFYSADSKYRKSGFIVGKKTAQGVRYGYIDYKRKQILKNDFSEIYRIVEKNSDGMIWLVAVKNGQAGLFCNNKKVIDNCYEDILYDQHTDLLTLQSGSKQGVANVEGKIIIPIEYENIWFAGDYINAKSGENVDIYDKFGVKVNDGYISKRVVGDGKYEIVSDADDEYKVLNKNKNTVIEDDYNYIEYLFGKFFIVTKGQNLGIIDDEGNIVKEIKYSSVQLVENSKIVRLLSKGGKTTILNESLDEVVDINNANIFYKNDYIEIIGDNEIIYLNKQGERVENAEVYKENDLHAYKEKNKWGFKSKDGKVVVEPKFDFVTEFNEYGFAGVKKAGKWGALNNFGEVVLEPKYEINEAMLPFFLGRFYKVNLGYGDPYFTD